MSRGLSPGPALRGQVGAAGAVRVPPVLRIARRLEARPEHRPAEGQLARQHERAAGYGGAARAAAAPAEPPRAPERRALRGDAQSPGSALLVRLADEAEPLLHQLERCV